MTQPAIFEIIARAADDPNLLREMLVDPESVATDYELTLVERDLLDRLGRYDLARVNRAALADASDLAAALMKLRVASAADNPEVYEFLAERLEELVHAVNRLEMERFIEAAEARDEANACPDVLRAMQIALLLVALVVAILRIFAEENDPE